MPISDVHGADKLTSQQLADLMLHAWREMREARKRRDVENASFWYVEFEALAAILNNR